MLIARRALLLGGAFGLVACTGDPRIDVDPAATPNVQASEDPIQDPALAAAAAAIASVRFHLDAADEGPWRDAAIAQCDAQLARFNSPTPFGDPDPVFTASPASADDLDEALDVAVTTLKECAADTDAVGLRLLFISAAAATVGLGDPFSIPGTGTDPTHVDVLESTTELALGHVWALINGLEKALGNVTGDDALRLALSGRLAEARTLRTELRDALDGAAPAQPTAFELPTDMVEIPEILTGWGVLEVRLLEALVLLSADDTSAPSRWEQQVVQAQATGGQIPRWPGWD